MSNKVVGKRTLLKSGFWYVVSMFLTRGMVFITMPIFTRIMTKEEYGNFSVFVSWQTILLIICSVDLYGTLNRARFDYPKANDFHSYISSCLSLSFLITITVFIAYSIFPRYFDRFFLLNRSYMFVMFAYLLTVPALNMFMTMQRIEYRYKTSSAISISVAILSPVFAIVMVLLMKDRDPVFGRIIGQFSLYIVLGIVFYVYFFSLSKEISVSCWKYALRIGIPLAFSYLGSRILLMADTIVLKHLCTGAEVSYLSVTHTASQIILILVQALNIAWSPWFYDMLKSHNYGEIKRTYRWYLWAMVFCTFAVILIGPELILVLGGKKYFESIYIFPLNVLCGVFAVFTAQFVDLETYHKRPEYAAILTGIVAVINVILDILGVKLFGYQAVCYVTVICQVLLVGLHYCVTKSMGNDKIISLKTLIFTLVTTIMLIPIALFMYQSNIIRGALFAIEVLIIITMIIIKRKDIMLIVKKKYNPNKED